MTDEKRRICVVLVDRANYGRMKPVMSAILAHPELTLQTLCTGTMVLERFGEAAKIVEADGFSVDSRIYIELEGSVEGVSRQSFFDQLDTFHDEADSTLAPCPGLFEKA